MPSMPVVVGLVRFDLMRSLSHREVGANFAPVGTEIGQVGQVGVNFCRLQRDDLRSMFRRSFSMMTRSVGSSSERNPWSWVLAFLGHHSHLEYFPEYS